MSKLLHQPTSLKIKTNAKQEEQPPTHTTLQCSLLYLPAYVPLSGTPALVAQGSNMTMCAGWLTALLPVLTLSLSYRCQTLEEHRNHNK